MHFHKVIVFVFLIVTFLVCGEKEEPLVVGMNNKQQSNKTEKKQSQRKHEHQRSNQPFGVYLSQMRKVPNASDPLHNR